MVVQKKVYYLAMTTQYFDSRYRNRYYFYDAVVSCTPEGIGHSLGVGTLRLGVGPLLSFINYQCKIEDGI